MFNSNNRNLIIAFITFTLVALIGCFGYTRLQFIKLKLSVKAIERSIENKALNNPSAINPSNISFVRLPDDTGLVTKPINNFAMFIDLKDGYVSQVIKQTATWQPEILNTLKKIVKPGNKVIHLGGHIGFFDIILGGLVTKVGKVWTFEPNPLSYRILRKNIILHDLQDVVDTYPYGAWSSKAQKDLCFNYGNSGGATLGDHNMEKCVNVNLEKVDDVIGSQIDHIDLLFMDIEGAEIHAIEGAEKLLARSPDCIIVLEWNMNYLKNVFHSPVEEFIKNKISSGYSFYEILIQTDESQDPTYKKLSFEELMQKTHCDLIIIPPTIIAGELLVNIIY